MRTKVKKIESSEVNEILLNPEEYRPKVSIEIEGNINRVKIVTMQKRRIVGYIKDFHEIILGD